MPALSPIVAPMLAMMTTDTASHASSGTSTTGADFFTIASQRLAYIDQRQRILAQNIANADTPGYKARDLSPFDKLLHERPVTPAQTNALHLAGTSNASLQIQAAQERAPDGNAVNIEDELTKVADDETSSAMVGNLWKTTMSMYLTALGRSG
jgi:flagellar basal-body rod protein FlgB